MHLRLKVFLGVLGTLTVLTLSLTVFFYYLITKSYPATSGTENVVGIQAEVQVYRDDYGVPHVYANSEHDAYYAVGYIHAQDRLWQMELIRRAGEGRLAEILGEPALKIDRMFRMLGLWRQAQKNAPDVDAKTRVALEAYADGVSHYIASHKGKYPIEFDLLNFEPEPWTIAHSLLVSRLMAWELNYSRWVDIVLGQLVERLGATKASEIFPTWPEGAPLIVPDELRGRKTSAMADQLLDADQAFRQLLGNAGMESGSNAWVVSGAKSVTGKPILANDPHLLFSAPGRWYEIHVVGPDLDVSGASIAGVPFVVIGHNQSIAWGVTNAMLDDEDFYVEEVDSVQHPTRYRFNNTWRPVEREVDTILVKNSPPVLLTTYSTHRGPIVNRMEPAAQYSRQLLSMRWVGHDNSNEAQAFSMINRAHSWKEFLEGLRHYAVPAQNFVYADVDGNIGYHTGGRIPVRKTKTATLPFPGWTDEYDWKGYVPFEQMPQSFNPPEGFIATANNKIVSDSYPHYLSNLWEPDWRITRISELLRKQERFSVEDMQRLQQDVLSPQARELVPIILKAYDTSPPQGTDVRTTLTYFRNWNYEMRPNDVATTLFQSFLVQMVRNTFEDEMGPQLLGVYDTLATVPLAAITNLMKKGSSAWFDDIRTPQAEAMVDIIRRSVEDGVRDLKTKFGGEIKEMRWGTAHQVEFPHVFGSHDLLRRIFNVGPFPSGGSHSTVNKGDFRLSQTFQHYVGPSTRQIFDLSNRNNTRSVTPPGQSGQVFQHHYDDQVQLWLNGGYRTQLMDRSAIENAGYDRLLLRPAQ
ncbi:MAG: penicillin acylase family protein [Ignavibacteriales bacterium]|nr:penicillin acylase family protein [Ignavibacteriales bacterium]